MTQRTLFLGIDPGLDGGIALYDPERRVLHNAWRTPTVDIATGGKGKRRIDMHALAEQFDRHRLIINKAVIEEVGSRPGESVTASFNFGFTTGALHALLAAHKIPYMTVTPSRWKLAMKVGADKEGARLHASRLMPEGAACWPRKGDDGVAEAALLAYWLAKQEGYSLNKIQELM